MIMSNAMVRHHMTTTSSRKNPNAELFAAIQVLVEKNTIDRSMHMNSYVHSQVEYDGYNWCNILGA